mgnify:CR=1 FL=1
MDRFTAFFDANVLYPAELRNFIMRLTMRDLFRARWSYLVHEEWITAIFSRRPDLTRAQLERTRDLMNEHAEDCLVTGFERLIDGLDLPDKDDRHVLAAAIRAGAGVIVTRNIKDFPYDKLDPYGMEAHLPDVLERQELTQTVAVLRGYRQVI